MQEIIQYSSTSIHDDPSGRCKYAISKLTHGGLIIYCVIIILNLYIFQIEEHNNEISPQPSASSVMANGDPSPTTSTDKSPPDSPQPSTSGVQSGSDRPSDHELGYSLQPRRAYDAVKFGIKGTDYTIVLKNAGTRHYQQLVNEFTSIMNDIVDETLVNADPNDYV